MKARNRQVSGVTPISVGIVMNETPPMTTVHSHDPEGGRAKTEALREFGICLLTTQRIIV
jgi:hypothetical protein